MKRDPSYCNSVDAAIADDLNTAKVLALMHEILRDTALVPIVKRNTLRYADRVLGILRRPKKEPATHSIPPEVQRLLAERDTARANKAYQEADALRDQISDLGYEVIDTDRATTVIPKIK